MDYQFVCTLQFLIALFCTCLNSANSVVGRDLVLTPKQGLQLNGKSIYYEEDSNEVQSSARRPWERTLKHVTFVTLFANVAAGAVTGNVSQLKEYSDFLRSPYISHREANDARFGDIATLATGRLEKVQADDTDVGAFNNATAAYRFIEGVCDYDDCEAAPIWALWQVQKIRHREATNRKFRYEMKFSVSPTGSAALGGANKRWTDAVLRRGDNSQQTYIQKEDDYPQSFGRIIYPDEGDRGDEVASSFADRRQDDEFAAGRNFRQVLPPSAAHDYRRPQATFMHAIFQAPPPPPEKLNIGEQYLKHYPVATAGKALPKIELFPNLINTAHRNDGVAYTQHAHTPTTYRPNYQVKFPRPEIYQPAPPLPHKLMRYPPALEHPSSPAAQQLAAAGRTPVVTHHFHHHFYMPSSIENGLSGEQASTAGFKHATTTADVKPPMSPQSQTPSYYANFVDGGVGYDEPQPAPQKFVFPVPSPLHHNEPIEEEAEDDEAANGLQLQQHMLVHVTPPPSVPPLRRPQIYQVFHHPPQPLPLLIYPAPVDEATTEAAHHEFRSRHNKPFIRSEPLDEQSVRYSEPDPLYFSHTSHDPRQAGKAAAAAGGGGRGQEVHSYELSAPQLEAPTRNKIVAGTPQMHVEDYRPNTAVENSKNPSPEPPQPDSIVAQLPPPDKDQDVRIPYVEEDEQDKAKPEPEVTTQPAKEHDLEQKPSLKDVTISTEKSTTTTYAESDSPPQSVTLIQGTTTTPATTNPAANTLEPSATLSATNVSHSKFKHRNSIVSTSTTESPLRAVSRQRGGGYVTPPRTTTEAPVLKWRPRRRGNASTSFTTTNDDSRAKSSVRHEEKVSAVTVTTTAAATTTPAQSQSGTVVVASPPTTPSLLFQSASDEIFEVLTQKSVSKSVSIKVGSNGEEIPIIVDDEYNVEKGKKTKATEDNEVENEVQRE